MDTAVNCEVLNEITLHMFLKIASVLRDTIELPKRKPNMQCIFFTLGQEEFERIRTERLVEGRREQIRGGVFIKLFVGHLV